MKSQILFPGKNKKKNVIHLSSAELTQRVAKVNLIPQDIFFLFFLSHDFHPSFHILSNLPHLFCTPVFLFLPLTWFSVPDPTPGRRRRLAIKHLSMSTPPPTPPPPPTHTHTSPWPPLSAPPPTHTHTHLPLTPSEWWRKSLPSGKWKATEKGGFKIPKLENLQKNVKNL